MRVGELTVSRRHPRGPAMPAYVAGPDGEGLHPGVLVIHELFGFNPSIRAAADRLAGEGYVALVVDLFAGYRPVVNLARAIVGVAIQPLHNRLLGDIACGLAALRGLAGVDGSRVATLGFSMGGSYALQLACVAPDLRAAATFYGQNPRPLVALRQACPIVASFAARDPTTAGEPRRLARALETFGVAHDVKVYSQARHGFCRAGDHAFSPADAANAWSRALTFFDQHLRPAEARFATRY